MAHFEEEKTSNTVTGAFLQFISRIFSIGCKKSQKSQNLEKNFYLNLTSVF